MDCSLIGVIVGGGWECMNTLNYCLVWPVAGRSKGLFQF